MAEIKAINLTIEFSGGAELLFDNVKKHKITLPESNGKECDMRDLLQFIKDNLIKKTPDLLVIGGSVRPGILVLINEVDWELMDELDYKLKDGDNILFISTLHGG